MIAWESVLQSVTNPKFSPIYQINGTRVESIDAGLGRAHRNIRYFEKGPRDGLMGICHANLDPLTPVIVRWREKPNEMWIRWNGDRAVSAIIYDVIMDEIGWGGDDWIRAAQQDAWEHWIWG